MFERILWAAARRTCPVVFSEMSLSAVAPENVPTTYVARVRPGLGAAAVRRPSGPGGSQAALYCALGPFFNSEQKQAIRLFGVAKTILMHF